MLLSSTQCNRFVTAACVVFFLQSGYASAQVSPENPVDGTKPVPEVQAEQVEHTDRAMMSDNQLMNLIEHMGDPELSIRDDAALAILRDESAALTRLEEILKNNHTLTPEQRLRLLWITRSRFFQTPRGAIGISFGQGNDAGRIGKTYDHFPSSKTLRVGDAIIAIQGHSMDQLLSTLRRQVISQDPGQKLIFDILRDGQRLKVPVELGSWDMLPNSPRLGRAELADAWLWRSQSYWLDQSSAGSSVPIDTGLAPEAWYPPAGSTQVLTRRSSRSRGFENQPPFLVAGGEPRMDLITDALRVDPSAQGWRGAGGAGGIDEAEQAMFNRLQAELDQLYNQRATIVDSIARSEKLLDLKVNEPLQQKSILKRITVQKQMLIQYDQQIIQLQSILRRR